MIISYGEDARDVFRSMVGQIPAGYIVALLDTGEDIDPISFIRGTDAELVTTTPEGVAYRDVTDTGSTVDGPIKIRRWEEIDRVHVY